jgi:hypothetical protein
MPELGHEDLGREDRKLAAYGQQIDPRHEPGPDG